MPSKCQSQIIRLIVPQNVSMDLKISTLKPLHATWVTQYFNFIGTNKEIEKNRWQIARINKALEGNINKEHPFEHSIVKLMLVIQLKKMWFSFNQYHLSIFVSTLNQFPFNNGLIIFKTVIIFGICYLLKLIFEKRDVPQNKSTN